MRNRLSHFFTILLVCLVMPSTGWAEDIMMVRSEQKFPEAMLTLQTSLREHGYNVTRVQRIDIGLTGMGYKTDKYRVVFVAKPDEIHYLAEHYPQLVPYLPPKVSIFAENEETVLVTANPKIYAEMVDEKDRVIFRRWMSDIYSVFDDIRNAD